MHLAHGYGGWDDAKVKSVSDRPDRRAVGVDSASGAAANGKSGRPRRVDTRKVVNAIFYVMRTGCQWRILTKTMALRRGEVYAREERTPEPATGIMGSQTMKSTETRGERGWDGGKKDKGTQTPPGGGHVGVTVGGVGDRG